MSEFNLSGWALRNRSLVVYFMIVAVLAGIAAFVGIGRNEDPAFTIKTMVVQAAWPGATLEDTAQQVTERIERKLQELPGVDTLRSLTRAGVTTIFVDLQGAVTAPEIPAMWQQVRNDIGDIRHTLPAGMVGPFFNDRFGDTFGIIYGFTADGFTQRELRDQVEEVRSKLLHVPDVSVIEIIGAQDEVIFVEFSMEQLASLGVDRQAFLAALQTQNVVRPAGIIQTGDERISVRVTGAFESEQDILDINFVARGRMLRLADVAQVRRGFADPPQPMFRVNGQPAIGLGIAMRDGGDILALGQNIKQAMAKITADLPVGIEPVLVADQPVTVDEAIGEFTTSLWQAIAIILVVSFISLGVRPGLVVALAIPLTLAIVFPVMQLTGIDMQRISLGALIIALALLVDDAMTTTDAMLTRLSAGDDQESAAKFAFRHYAFAMLAGTFVTIAGFVPVGFAQSSAGEYTFSLFAVVTIALLVSWLVAVIFAPLMGVAILTRPKQQASAEPPLVVRWYRRLLVAALRLRWITIAVTIALFIGSILLLPLIPRQFFPSSDRPELVVDLTLPQNASIYASETVASRFDNLLKEDPDVLRWSTYVGRGAIRFYLPLNVQLANDFFSQAVIVATDVAARERLRLKLETTLAEDFPQLVSRIYPLELGPPVGWPVQYRVSGPDLAQVRTIALDLAQLVATSQRVEKVNFDWIEPTREVRIHIDQDRARLLGRGGGRLERGAHRHAGDPAARRHLPDQRGSPRHRRAAGLALDPVDLAGAAAGRADCAARPVRQLRVRPGLPPGLAARPRSYPHRPGRCRAGRTAGKRDRRAGRCRGRAHRRPARRLPDRGRRHGGGKCQVAGLGDRGGAGDAVHHAHRADGAAPQLPAPGDRPERGAAGPDRRGAGPAAVRPAARLRRDPGHPGADRHRHQERGDPDRPDRGRAAARQERVRRGGRGRHRTFPADHADRDLHCAGHDPDRTHRVLGADGVLHHGRAADRYAPDPDFSAGGLCRLVQPAQDLGSGRSPGASRPRRHRLRRKHIW
jgi:multidrug efflux pump subunit AcrB